MIDRAGWVKDTERTSFFDRLKYKRRYTFSSIALKRSNKKYFYKAVVSQNPSQFIFT